MKTQGTTGEFKYDWERYIHSRLMIVNALPPGRPLPNAVSTAAEGVPLTKEQQDDLRYLAERLYELGVRGVDDLGELEFDASYRRGTHHVHDSPRRR